MQAVLTRIFSAISRIVCHQRIHPGTHLQKHTRRVESAARVSPRVSGAIALARKTACFAGSIFSISISTYHMNHYEFVQN